MGASLEDIDAVFRESPSVLQTVKHAQVRMASSVGVEHSLEKPDVSLKESV